MSSVSVVSGDVSSLRPAASSMRTPISECPRRMVASTVIRLTAVIEIEGQAPRALTHESNARTVVLGRDRSADFQLPLATISRHHIRISETDQVYFVEDLGSTHGTLLNGKRLPGNEKKMLRDGDILELTRARVTCSIQTEKLASDNTGEETQAIALRAVQGILGRLGEGQEEGPFLRLLSGPLEGRRYPLATQLAEWRIGRSRDCEIAIDDANISRQHAILKKDWNGYILQDLRSKNGIRVNGRKVIRPHRLSDRDEIALGPTKLLFVDPDAELLSALKDVPGFAVDDPIGPGVLDDDPSMVGAPAEEQEGLQSELDGENHDDDNDMFHAEGLPELVASDEESVEEDAYEGIDPELLADPEPNHRRPLLWLGMLSVAGLVMLAGTLLVAILS